VQVKLRDPDGRYAGGFGPSLRLNWADGRSIRIGAWEAGAETVAGRFVCEGTIGKKRLFAKHGDKPDVINWVRIELKPNRIDFQTSTDGEAWKLLLSKPRKGFEGSPAELILGHGRKADGPREGYAFDSYFDDLVTANLPK